MTLRELWNVLDTWRFIWINYDGGCAMYSGALEEPTDYMEKTVSYITTNAQGDLVIEVE